MQLEAIAARLLLILPLEEELLIFICTMLYIYRHCYTGWGKTSNLAFCLFMYTSYLCLCLSTYLELERMGLTRMYFH